MGPKGGGFGPRKFFGSQISRGPYGGWNSEKYPGTLKDPEKPKNTWGPGSLHQDPSPRIRGRPGSFGAVLGSGREGRQRHR